MKIKFRKKHNKTKDKEKKYKRTFYREKKQTKKWQYRKKDVDVGTKKDQMNVRRWGRVQFQIAVIEYCRE